MITYSENQILSMSGEIYVQEGTRNQTFTKKNSKEKSLKLFEMLLFS